MVYSCQTLRRSMLLASVALLFPSTSFADEAPDQAAGANEIVVAGNRLGTSVDEKKEASGILDALSADQLESLPVKTIAEALVHVPGISVSANSDNERGRNTLEHAAIRGLDAKYNNVTLDGLPIAATDFTGTGVSSRAVPLDLLPASLLADLKVYKTYSPDRDPQAIGGGVELRTRSAFDPGGERYFRMEVDGGVNSQNGQPRPLNPVNASADIVASTRFGASDQFGAVLSVNVQRSTDYTYDNATTDSVFYTYYTAAGQLASAPQPNGYAVPQQSKAWIIQEDNQKYNVTGKVEYQPIDTLHGFITLGYYDTASNQNRNEVIITPNYPTLTNPTATTGSYASGDVEVGGQYMPQRQRTYNGQTGIDYRPTPDDLIEARAGDSHALLRQPQYMVKFFSQTAFTSNTDSPKQVAAYGFNYQLYPNYSNFNLNPAAYEDTADYQGDYWRHRKRELDTYVTSLKLEYAHNADAQSEGFGFKIGADGRQTRNDVNFFTPEWDANGPAPGLNLAAVQLANSFKLPNYNLPFLAINVTSAFNLLNANPGLFHVTNQVNNNHSSDFSLREGLADPYALAVYNQSDLQAMIGLRHDAASISVTGNELAPAAAGGAQVWQSITAPAQYAHYLPAASIAYRPDPSVQVRGAISQAIGRPDFSDYSPNTTVSQDPGTGNLTISQGNPALKPRLSTNYDTGVEWYFAKDSLVSATPFYKSIANEIYSVTSVSTVDFLGQTVQATTTQPINASSATLKGAEFELVQSNLAALSPWLEGFGVNANVTWLQGSSNVAQSTGGTRKINGLINQPGEIANLILSYADAAFSGAISYNYTGQSLRLLNPNLAFQDVHWSPHQQVDLKLGYKLNQDVAFTFSATNLTGETVKSVTGPNQDLLKDNYFVGQTYWAGVVYRPSGL